jgi:hypothetical protein
MAMIESIPRRAALLLGGLVLGLLLFSAQPLQAESDGCALLKPVDLTTLLGGTPIATSNQGGCIWTASDSARKLIAIKYRATGPAAEMAFAGARGNAGKDGKVVNDEAGLGDKAFASLESFGVALVMFKQGRLLQLQYWPGAAGTAKDLQALRPVAKKAIAAF